MSTVNTIKKTFFGNDGLPLKSGYIYIGQPGTDPQVSSNQKTVTFEDSQGNQFSASQPLRTNSDGRIQYNGKAIIATVDGSYSQLILDSKQVEINDGWTPTIDDSTDTDAALEDYRRYSLTLAELKQLEVSQGQTVANVGKESAGDGLGSKWLVVSNTGETADNVNLIDFDNGLQGQVITTETPDYSTDDFTRTTQYYIASPSLMTSSEVNITTEVDAGTEFTVGPTGSGADVIMDALDDIPNDAVFVKLAIDVIMEYEEFGDGYGGFSFSLNVNDRVAILLRNARLDVDLANTRILQEFDAQLDDDNKFSVTGASLFGEVDSCNLRIRGFGI